MHFIKRKKVLTGSLADPDSTSVFYEIDPLTGQEVKRAPYYVEFFLLSNNYLFAYFILYAVLMAFGELLTLFIDPLKLIFGSLMLILIVHIVARVYIYFRYKEVDIDSSQLIHTAVSKKKEVKVI